MDNRVVVTFLMLCTCGQFVDDCVSNVHTMHTCHIPNVSGNFMSQKNVDGIFWLDDAFPLTAILFFLLVVLFPDRAGCRFPATWILSHGHV